MCREETPVILNNSGLGPLACVQMQVRASPILMLSLPPFLLFGGFLTAVQLPVKHSAGAKALRAVREGSQQQRLLSGEIKTKSCWFHSRQLWLLSPGLPQCWDHESIYFISLSRDIFTS